MFVRFFLFLVAFSSSIDAFAPGIARWYPPQRESGDAVRQTVRLSSFSVPASELEKDLFDSEKTVVSVVRENGPSVAFVTSVIPAASVSSSSSGRRGRRSRNRRENDRDDRDDRDQSAGNDKRRPRGQSLGSGSAFVVDSRNGGYLVTNYHVIERAYQLQKSADMALQLRDDLVGNATEGLRDFVNLTISSLLFSTLDVDEQNFLRPQVYVRINSATNFQRCEIVDVDPSLDVAVLRIEEDQQGTSDVNATADASPIPTMSFGTSSKLLVGQNLIAIGNPFGLDNSVTTGVVSALNREIQTSSGMGMAPNQPIRNCIQTDCAINPGNSGGPLLNSKGEVVGVNTAILTTSGSNSGVGFAVPSDQVRPVVEQFIRKDVRKTRGGTSGRASKAELGVSIIDRSNGGESKLFSKNWVVHVRRDSPADQAGIRSLMIRKTSDAGVQYGDAIVAVGGNSVPTFDDLQKELDRCVAGEKVQITLEDERGDRRVVYVTLG